MITVRELHDQLRTQDPHDVQGVVKVMNAAAACLQRLAYALHGAVDSMQLADMTPAKADVLIYCHDLSLAPASVHVDEIMSD